MRLAAIAAFGAGAWAMVPVAQAQGNDIVVDEVSVTEVNAPGCKTYYAVGRSDNWYLQLGAGIASPFFENRLPRGDAKHHITASYYLGAGKWMSPYLGFRLSSYFSALHWDNDSYSKMKYVNLNFDLMWDMFNSLGGVNASRPFSLIPYVGLGGAYAWDIRSTGTNVPEDNGKLKRRTWTLPVSAGLQMRFRVCQYMDIFVEGRAGFFGDNFNGCAYDKSIDVNLQAIAGLSFNLGGVNYRPYSPCADAAYIASLNGQVNALRGELATTAAALAAAEAQLPCPEVPEAVATETVINAPLMSTVRFTINSARISNEEMVNVFNTAEYLKANPNVSVIIRGYADKDTGTADYNLKLSERRATAVYNALTKTYGIAPERLTMEAAGSSTQVYDTNNWNRIVIFVPAF